MKAATIGMLLLLGSFVAAAPSAAAECVEGAGSMACVYDYSSGDSSYYMADAQLADGTYVYGSFSEGSNWFGDGIIWADGWIDSPTAGHGWYGYLFLSDRSPTDGAYENGEAYGELYGYDGTYEWGYIGFYDMNGDGQADAESVYYFVSLIP